MIIYLTEDECLGIRIGRGTEQMLPKPSIATQTDIDGLRQMIRIGMVLSLTHAIQARKPSRSFAECKLEAIEQFESAVSEDWQL